MQNLEQERARFEELYDSGKIYSTALDSEVGFYDCTKQMAWAAWQARCPEGYSVVPNEATEEMITSGKEAILHSIAPVPAFTCYRAMLAAAPHPGEES